MLRGVGLSQACVMLFVSNSLQSVPVQRYMLSHTDAGLLGAIVTRPCIDRRCWKPSSSSAELCRLETAGVWQWEGNSTK